MNFFIMRTCVFIACLCCHVAVAGEPVTTATQTAAPKISNDDETEKAKLSQQYTEFRQWMFERGYMKSLPDFIYFTFSDASLYTLINNGNTRAMLTLANRYRFNTKRKNEVLDLYKLAAVYGSTYALSEMASVIYISSDHKLSDEDRHALWVEVMAWNELTHLRGDVYGYAKNSSFMARKKSQLTPDDFALAKNNAETIYQELLSRRIALGLGEFDNTVPLNVKMLTERVYGTDPYHKIRTKPL